LTRELVELWLVLLEVEEAVEGLLLELLEVGVLVDEEELGAELELEEAVLVVLEVFELGDVVALEEVEVAGEPIFEKAKYDMPPTAAITSTTARTTLDAIALLRCDSLFNFFALFYHAL